ncbi:universal stress protein [Pseudogracilibacillus auburnensis]|uniref:Universal stress protein n=1 Tax=Pseudogracilibacillus auburnensis TaxID=1494959 RepID=A0A2V3VTV7_9BACI|nr:universal stress protein [Pseudogracilibacillus auburnensis]MBO1003370.1 universal stress protein [Pseudogracilibacillus auburnensis]PXW85327.1 nucleotide-binding universal stress UspA family protein [Pseudogracilibacillus auburnensis]
MNGKYEKIVSAVDGSKASEKAFKKSVEIAKENNATLVLAHIVDSRTFATAEAYDKSLSERAEKYARDLLNEYVENAKEAGVEKVELVIKYGSPKVAIAKEIAPEYEADLIIVGATGLNAVERFLIGSVSESVARYSKCDVLIVR